MTADTMVPASKRRKRRALAALKMFRRHLSRLCHEFEDASKWYDAVKSYLNPLLDAYPDVLAGGARSRLEGAMNVANEVQGNA